DDARGDREAGLARKAVRRRDHAHPPGVGGAARLVRLVPLTSCRGWGAGARRGRGYPMGGGAMGLRAAPLLLVVDKEGIATGHGAVALTLASPLPEAHDAAQR